jgi:hypothetical protein
LQGCVLTGLLGGAVAPKIPDVDVQIGKENHKEENLAKIESIDVSTKQSAENINNTYMFPWWAFIITAVCGILVDPLRIYKEWREVRNGR